MNNCLVCNEGNKTLCALSFINLMLKKLKNCSVVQVFWQQTLIPGVDCVQRSGFVKTGPGHCDSEVVVVEVTEVEGLWVHETVLPHPPGCPPSVRTAG